MMANATTTLLIMSLALGPMAAALAVAEIARGLHVGARAVRRARLVACTCAGATVLLAAAGPTDSFNSSKHFAFAQCTTRACNDPVVLEARRPAVPKTRGPDSAPPT